MTEYIDLLEKHKDEVRFKLFVRHKRLGLYVARDGLLAERRFALLFDSKRIQPPIEEIVETFSESANWLHNCDIEYNDYGIESELS